MNTVLAAAQQTSFLDTATFPIIIAVIAIVLELGMPPNDLKLFTAVLVAIALSLPLIKNKFAIMKRSEEADA